MAHQSPPMQPPAQRPSPLPFDDQPGLEVVPHDYLPEVRPEEEPKFYLVPAQHQAQKAHLSEDFPQAVDSNGELDVGSPTSTEKGTLPVSKSYQRAGDDNSNAVLNSRPETIRQGSKLSAVGWRKANGDVERFLFYLDPQGRVRRSRSITGPGSSTSIWEEQPVLDLKATNGTSLAATIALDGRAYNPQTVLFYEEDTKVFAAVINETIQPNIQTESFSGGYGRDIGDFTMASGASLGSYWPYVVTQHESGHIIQNDLALRRGLVPSSGHDWYVKNLTIAAYEGTSLCIVPTSTNFTKIRDYEAYGVVYQKPNQGIALHYPAFGPGTNESVQRDQVPEIFPLEYVFPPQAPMAAFAVAQNDNDDEGPVNIYLIIKSYTSGTFSVWFTENSSYWMEESPAVFQNVDEDSDIACSSLAVTNSDWEEQEVPLAPDNVRCYFQRNGTVVEVSFEGSGWTEIGVVPIP
ncbi:uncharacterized protein PODANS_5_10835 [Podospora anserina S mat+]|uniref:Podospora anserina S mat+ genomic DNA chromosome 5, supercontig 10 n=1 Tax=Podospora anserina (strain S / ATCC MYA-4624 / DSM 980 / FGSC 10383) TaxID=515849 RepID=B2APF9_PODAN|nr:uncharacterized protein PODANS_5_10835 [Podospora anserina S mat+]CAP65876.1 unnamed protein product [Podospora anserina S mat+]CDP30262.1 Putative protein of unknown function [Podospora anserina S mat+]